MDTLDDMTKKYSAAKLSIAGADTERESLFESLVIYAGIKVKPC